ncbi:MAG: protease HtpX [Candidatus Binatia bacterium]|nr:protease HtpX [Candidatus Binatia bacterium]
MTRIFLFLATNIAILVVLSTVLSLFGFEGYLAQNGLDMGQLLLFCAVFGMGGSFISLAMSKWIAKRSVGAQVITDPKDQSSQWLIATVQTLARQANIGMPEVAVFNSPEPNAFATGASKNNALVAVSTGLLQNMNKEEITAVLGHEISHVSNGDMVTLTLIQGVLNTFVMFLARVVGYAIDKAVFRNERDGVGIGYFVTVIVAQILFGILASIIVRWFSRRREFRADAGGASLAGRDSMIGALEALKGPSEPVGLPEQMAAFGVAGGASKWSDLFRTHPPLDDRIAALRNAS